jgi:hypothetical protein
MMDPRIKVEEFRDDDRAYLDWVARNPRGFVINIQRSLNSSDAKLHRAACHTVTGTPPRGRTWTGPYIKVCSLDLGSVDDWATGRTRAPIKRCRTCHPPAHAPEKPDAPPAIPAVNPPPPPQASRPSQTPIATPACARHHQWEIRGPSSANPMLEAWIDDYIRFERRPPHQEQLRSAIRERLRVLDARRDQVLHATFLGPKHPAADVENIALYYIDDTGRSFARAARSGLRFELAPCVPRSPTGKEYTYGYRYELTARRAPFRHWAETRELASWDWVDLGRFSGEKKLEQVWLALARTTTTVASPGRTSGAPFAVRLTIRTPRSTTPALGALVKGVVDARCAWNNLVELATRLARVIPASPEEIQALLANEDNAVLGAVPRLLHIRGAGVQWAPADDMCLAGELLAAKGTTDSWTLKGSIVELQPASSPPAG